MKFTRLYLNRLQNLPEVHDTVVVIDVLRSFTTAAVALDNGARAIYPVDGVAAANALAARLADSVLVGAVGGGDPVPGFDFGNSPSQLLPVDLTGKAVVLTTAAGVHGLQRFRQARCLYAASLLCARATAMAIRASEAREVCFVITGEWVDRDGDEDIVCADYIEALLCGASITAGVLAERVRRSDFGRRFGTGRWANLPPADLAIATTIDKFAFPMPVHREDGQLVIRR
jgi:2-phosphosulfolactate phosphatase